MSNDSDGWQPLTSLRRTKIMYTDTENTGAPMVPESTRRKPNDHDDERRFREEMVLSHRLPK